MKALVKGFEGVDITLPFIIIKFKKSNITTESIIANTTGLNKVKDE